MDSVFRYWNPRMDYGSNESIIREDSIYKDKFAFLEFMICQVFLLENSEK